MTALMLDRVAPGLLHLDPENGNAAEATTPPRRHQVQPGGALQSTGPGVRPLRAGTAPVPLQYNASLVSVNRASSPRARTPLETALWAIDLGLWPVPVRPYREGEPSAGKVPIGKAWGVTRPTEASIREAFRRNPGAGVGLKLGASGGVIDIDVDQPEHAGPVLQRIFPDGIPETLGYTNLDGKFHVLFRWDERLARLGKTVIKGTVGADGEVRGNAQYAGLEVRLGAPDGDARQVQSVIPPSPLDARGAVRQWTTNDVLLTLPESAIADLIRFATEAKPTPQPSADRKVRERQDDGRPSAEERASRYLAKCEPAVAGQNGHGQAFKTACSIGPGFDLPEAVALELLRTEWNPRCQPPWSEKELAHKVAEAYRVEPRRGRLLEQGRPVEPSTPTLRVVRPPDPEPPVPPPPPPVFDGPPKRLAADLLNVMPLDLECIPEALRGWIVDAAQRGGYPVEYPAAAMIVGIASLLGRRLLVRPKRFDNWAVVPNLWGAIVGPPSLKKSSAAKEMLDPLVRLEIEAAEAFGRSQSQALDDATIAEMQAADAKKQLAAAIRSKASSDELRMLAAQANAKQAEVAASTPRYIANDATIEKFGELLRDNPRGLLQFRDEMAGWLKSMDRQGHENDRTFFLEAWTGDSRYTADRIGRGTVIIDGVCVSVFGTIQPGPLGRYIKAAVAGEGADGMMARFQLLVYPDPPDEIIHVDRYPNSNAKARAFGVYQWIDKMDPSSHGAEYDELKNYHFLHFDDDGQELYDRWRLALDNRLLRGDESPLMACHLAKFGSLMPSLALLFHVIGAAGRDDLGRVSGVAAAMAIDWCEMLESHARRIYQAASEGDPELADQLAQRVRQSLPSPFTFRDVANKGWSGLDTVEAVRSAVGILEDRNWAKVETRQNPKGGRPTEVVHINPAVYAPREAE